LEARGDHHENAGSPHLAGESASLDQEISSSSPCIAATIRRHRSTQVVR
jgi:hypothetical protein